MILRVWDVTLRTSDLEQAVDFYENVLGLQKKYQFSSYAGFDCGGVEIGLMPGLQGQIPPDAPCVDFLVRDVDEAYRTLRDQGVQFLEEPHDTPWGGRIAPFADPDGNPLQLVQINWPRYLSASAPQ